MHSLSIKNIFYDEIDLRLCRYDKSKFQQKFIERSNNEGDVRQYLLSTGKLGNIIPEKIDLQVFDGWVDDKTITNQLDPYCKNVIRLQNPAENYFRGKSKYDRENLI